MQHPKRYLITAALPYANGQKHIGHLAGAYLPADIYVRYLKAQKEKLFLFAAAMNTEQPFPFRPPKKELLQELSSTSTIL